MADKGRATAEARSLDEYRRWFQEIVEDGFSNEHLPFVWELMKSPFVAYHYELMKPENNGSEDFRRSLRARFNEHRDAGAEFLLDKLDSGHDRDFWPEILFCLGSFRRSQYKPRIVRHARTFATGPDPYLRDRAIIVLGLAGDEPEFPILCDRVLHDPNAKCRAWAASSFMQMNYRSPSESLRLAALKTISTALATEDDYFVLATFIETVGAIEDKKFGISTSDLERCIPDKIDIAKAKLERYLAKVLAK